MRNPESPRRETADARFARRLWTKARRKVALLRGDVPVWQMSEAEVTWVFRQAVKIGGDRLPA